MNEHLSHTREVVQRREVAEIRPSLEEDASFAERKVGARTREMMRNGRDNPKAYEDFKIAESRETNEDVVWICFPGLSDISDTHDGHIVPDKVDMVPKQGMTFTFLGPPAIAGYGPEQCIRATLAVLEEVRAIIAEHPDKEIKILGFSAGTHLAACIANELGRERGEPIADLVLVSPGMSMAKGIYSTWVSEPIARELLSREPPLTAEEYHRAIYEYTQEANVAFLPGGRNLKIFFGTNDSFIPPNKDGGTIDYIEHLRANGKAPSTFKYSGRDHITLVANLIFEVIRGNDPYHIHTKPSLWTNPETYRDRVCIQKIDEILSRFDDSELLAFAEVLSEHNGTTVEEDMSPGVRALARRLIDRDICAVATSPRYLWVKNGADSLEAMDPSERLFKKRLAERELPKIMRELKAIELDKSFIPDYERKNGKTDQPQLSLVEE